VQAAKAQGFVATAESLRNAALLIRQMLGDDVAGLLTVEGMTSGAFGSAFLEALKEPAKVEVLRQALELVGVTVGTQAVEALLTWVNVLRMSALVIELGWTIASGTSSGGLLFSSFPTPLPAQPTTSPDVPTTTAAPAAAETTSSTPEPSGSPADLDATSIQLANLQPGPAGNVFRCGATVTLVGTIHNPTAAPIAATVLFDTREGGPDTATSDSQDIVAPPGDSDYNPTTRPPRWPTARVSAGCSYGSSRLAWKIVRRCAGLRLPPAFDRLSPLVGVNVVRPRCAAGAAR
jgi:hypothetical protein